MDPLCCIAAIGLHLMSTHVNQSNELLVATSNQVNDANTGVYVEFINNVVVGSYYNTIHRQTSYVGYSKHSKIGSFDMAVTVGVVTGYEIPVAPAILPSVSYTFAGSIGARLFYVPKTIITGAHVFHIALEYRFD